MRPTIRSGVWGSVVTGRNCCWNSGRSSTLRRGRTKHAPLVHDFTDPNLETRFLGDLYQDLSDEAKKRYALLQTPEFIKEFILDRTLTPAIRRLAIRTCA